MGRIRAETWRLPYEAFRDVFEVCLDRIHGQELHKNKCILRPQNSIPLVFVGIDPCDSLVSYYQK
jgi:hypothetical protein